MKYQPSVLDHLLHSRGSLFFLLVDGFVILRGSSLVGSVFGTADKAIRIVGIDKWY